MTPVDAIARTNDETDISYEKDDLSGRIVRTMRLAITLCVLALLFTACRNVQPERRSSASEIRQYIPGEWTFSDKSDGSWFPKMILAEDHSFTVVRADGTRALLGTWECQSTMLKVTRTPAADSDARASAFLSNEWDYLPVIYADEHELVMTQGISVAGRMKFTR